MRFGEGESGCEPLVIRYWGVEHGRAARCSLVGQYDQLPRGLSNGEVDLGAPLLPAGAIQLIERDRFRLGTIAPEPIRFLNWHEALRSAGMLPVELHRRPSRPR
jgi:hypothetical protein